MPVWLGSVLGIVGKLLVKGLELLVPYWLGKSRQREKATGEAIERLGDAHDSVTRVRSDAEYRDELRDRYRG